MWSALFACLTPRKNLKPPVIFTMLSFKLFHICLILGQLAIPSAIMIPAFVHTHAPQTTESKLGPTLLSLPQSRTHCAKTLDCLRRRGDDIHVLNNGWLMKFLHIDSGLPIAIASALLEDFYERVLDRVHHFATTIAPLKVVSLYVLDLHLDFACDSAEVSWDFIMAFVTAMLDVTKRGFTGKFNAIMFHGPTETVVSVALRILGPADPNDSMETTTGLRMR